MNIRRLLLEKLLYEGLKDGVNLGSKVITILLLFNGRGHCVFKTSFDRYGRVSMCVNIYIFYIFIIIVFWGCVCVCYFLLCEKREKED